MTEPSLRVYLDDKFALDQRSLDAALLRRASRALAEDGAAVLDLGTGTGAMVRRILSSRAGTGLRITGLDREPALLAQADRELRAWAGANGFGWVSGDGATKLDMAGREVELRWRAADALTEFPTAAGEPTAFDLVTAHALMDLVPLGRMCARVHDWLRPGGLFYPTLAYDGETRFDPTYEDRGFEQAVLEAYDASMEQRTVAGEKVGGAEAGRRLGSALEAAGFRVLGCARSDWCIEPHRAPIWAGERRVTQFILTTVYEQCKGVPGISPRRLTRWYDARRAALDANTLALYIRHLDWLARKPPAP